ncbi:MAG: hypothetical protein AB2L14_37175 [Candidatus Xenobiia bacterium LiM19]
MGEDKKIRITAMISSHELEEFERFIAERKKSKSESLKEALKFYMEKITEEEELLEHYSCPEEHKLLFTHFLRSRGRLSYHLIPKVSDDDHAISDLSRALEIIAKYGGIGG